MGILIAILLLLALPVQAATYYVSTTGDNGNAGTEASPWRTLQFAFNTAAAGDTIYAAGGDYAEWVETAKHCSDGSRMTLKPNPTNGVPVVTRQLRIKHRYYWIEGIHVAYTVDTDPQNLNVAHIRIENTGSWAVVTNCVLRDTPKVVGWFHIVATNTDLAFTVTNSVNNFLTSNFVAGAHVFLGADSINLYTNHDKAARIKSISADGQTIVVTNNWATNWFPTEATQPRWAVIFPGQENGGYNVINLTPDTDGPTNCVIAGNMISNCIGPAFMLWGESNVIEDNYITRLHSYYAVRLHGRHQTIRRNTWRYSPNIIWHTSEELTDPVLHPADGGQYDYNVGAVHSQKTGSTNILFEHNWVEQFEQQLGVIDKRTLDGDGVFTLRSNVFIGVNMHMSQNADWITNQNNTFYRIAMDSAVAIAAGGEAANIQTNLDISNNAFIDCGTAHSPATGWYTTTYTSDSNLVNNFACGPETTGWHIKNATASNPLEHNGGDPGFVSLVNPIGPDGLAFTADDGLRPMSNSVLALNGIGALAPATHAANTPTAHFTVISQTNWLDYTYTNWNVNWFTSAPPNRGGAMRPWTTPDPIGNAPIKTIFSATNSLDGINGLTNTAISVYVWDFGDGARAVTTYPNAAHTFLLTGQTLVTLWVTNTAGQSAGHSNLYRILPSTNFTTGKIWYVDTNGNDTTGTGTNQNLPYASLDKAVSVMSGGDYIRVGPGTYYEDVDIDRNVAGVSSRITFVGNGSTVGHFNVRYPYFTFDGFELTGTNVALANTARVYLYEAADGIWMLNNYIHDSTNTFYGQGVYLRNDASPDPMDLQLNCIISNNIFDNIRDLNIRLNGSNHIVVNNQILNTSGEGDAFRIFGFNHRIANNVCSNLSDRGFGGHADVLQVFLQDSSNPSHWCKNIVFENNRVFGSDVQPFMFELKPDANYDYTNQVHFTNIFIRNNIYWNCTFAGSIDGDGVKIYNNLFYHCSFSTENASELLTNGAHVASFGGPKGSAFGTRIFNNIFFECGRGSLEYGWYSRMADQAITNLSLEADYNFVCGTNFGAKQTAPPNSNTRWASDGQEAHGVNGVDPKFVNAAAFDFRLQTNSPLIDAGTDLSGLSGLEAFSSDILGNTRTGTWDIGPYEGGVGGGDGEPAGTNTVSVQLQGTVRATGNVRFQ